MQTITKQFRVSIFVPNQAKLAFDGVVNGIDRQEVTDECRAKFKCRPNDIYVGELKESLVSENAMCASTYS